VQSWNQLLHHINLDQVGQVLRSACADKPVFQLRYAISSGVRVEALAKKVLYDNVERGSLIVADSQTHYYSFVP
jgi:hypothetical protein